MIFSTAAMNNGAAQNAASAVDLHRKMRASSSATATSNRRMPPNLVKSIFRKKGNDEWACVKAKPPDSGK